MLGAEITHDGAESPSVATQSVEKRSAMALQYALLKYISRAALEGFRADVYGLAPVNHRYALHIASVKLCADETMQGYQQQCLL